MDYQEIFNTVWNGLKSQGWKKSIDGHSHLCAYRGVDGCKCAAGWLLPDEEYTEVINNSSIMVVEYFIKTFPDEETFKFVRRLQIAHDSSQSPSGMQSELRRVARKYKLNVPEDE